MPEPGTDAVGVVNAGAERPIRWGILGAGWVARAFAAGLEQLPDARLVAVASRTSETARAFRDLHHPERVHDTYEALAADDDVDIVYIATPHHRHAADARLCIEHGRPVLCEKPFTLDAAQAREVVAAARARKVFCMEAMWTRSLPLVRRIRSMVADGAIGDVVMLTADFSHPAAFDPRSRLFDPDQGGGALLDRGVYGISFASMLLGSPDDVVSRALRGPTGVDDHVAVMMTFPGGAVAQVTASLRAMGSNEAVVVGTQGTMRVYSPFYRPERVRITDTPALVADSGEDGPPSFRSRLRSEVRRSVVARHLYERVRPVLESRPTIVERIHGNGYNYEAAEAQRCLRSGLFESPDISLDETISIMDTMDRARATWLPSKPG